MDEAGLIPSSQSGAGEPSRPRVVICDDSVLIQEALRAELESECDVVGLEEDGASAIKTVEAKQPDILLVDVSLPDVNGFVLTGKVLGQNPQVRVIFVSAHGDPAYAARAFEIGASGYVLKGSMRTELLAAVRTVMAGGQFRSALIPKS